MLRIKMEGEYGQVVSNSDVAGMRHRGLLEQNVFVMKLRCSICTKFKTSIVIRQNFSERWISGADSVRTSNVHNHVRSCRNN